MDHANRRGFVDSRIFSGKELGCLGGQHSRPDLSQTILKSLLSPLGSWEAQKPGLEFILSTWILGLGGQAKLSGGLVGEPVSLLRARFGTIAQDCPSPNLPLSKGSPLVREYCQLCVSVHQKLTPGRARSGPALTTCRVGIWEMPHQRPE